MALPSRFRGRRKAQQSSTTETTTNTQVKDKKKKKKQQRKSFVLAFGRLNPPHLGHGQLIHVVHRVARDERAPHLVVLSSSYGGQKNPLEPLQKLSYARKSFPGTNIKLASDQYPGLLQQVEKINGQFDHLHIVAGQDRVPEYTILLNKYNGKTYKFKTITIHSSGRRDEKSNHIIGLSGTKMREYVTKNDFISFKRGLSPRLTWMDARNLFGDLEKALNVKKEDIQFNKDFARSMMIELFAKGYPIIPDDNPDPVKDKDVEISKKAADNIRKVSRKKNQLDSIIGSKVVSNQGTGVGQTYDSRADGGASAASRGIGDPSFTEGTEYTAPLAPAFGANGTNKEPMQTPNDSVLSKMSGFSIRSKKKNFEQLRRSLPYG